MKSKKLIFLVLFTIPILTFGQSWNLSSLGQGGKDIHLEDSIITILTNEALYEATFDLDSIEIFNKTEIEGNPYFISVVDSNKVLILKDRIVSYPKFDDIYFFKSIKKKRSIPKDIIYDSTTNNLFLAFSEDLIIQLNTDFVLLDTLLLSNIFINDIVFKNDKLWVATNSGLVEIDIKRKTKSWVNGLENKSLSSIALLNQEDLVVGGSNAIWFISLNDHKVSKVSLCINEMLTKIMNYSIGFVVIGEKSINLFKNYSSVLQFSPEMGKYNQIVDIKYQHADSLFLVLYKSGNLLSAKFSTDFKSRICEESHIRDVSTQMLNRNGTANKIYRVSAHEPFWIRYDMKNKADRIIVREGKIIGEGKRIFDSKMVTGQGISPTLISKKNFINVEIVNGSKRAKDSVWSLEFVTQ